MSGLFNARTRATRNGSAYRRAVALSRGRFRLSGFQLGPIRVVETRDPAAPAAPTPLRSSCLGAEPLQVDTVSATVRKVSNTWGTTRGRRSRSGSPVGHWSWTTPSASPRRSSKAWLRRIVRTSSIGTSSCRSVPHTERDGQDPRLRPRKPGGNRSGHAESARRWARSGSRP